MYLLKTVYTFYIVLNIRNYILLPELAISWNE